MKTLIRLGRFQADQSLRWVHMSFCVFCRVAAHLFVLQYFWISFELSISVEGTFYGITVGYVSDNASVMVGRKNFLSRIREAPTGVGLGLCMPGRDKDLSSLR